jgi:hypothetical protein
MRVSPDEQPLSLLSCAEPAARPAFAENASVSNKKTPRDGLHRHDVELAYL